MLNAAAQEVKTTTEVITSLLPLALIMIPLLGALLTYLCGRYSDKLRNACAVLVTLLTAAAVMSGYPLLQEGVVEFVLFRSAQFKLFLRLDLFSFVFAAIISIIWFLATLHATAYMAHEHEQNRFFICLVATLGSCLGFVLAGDLITLFVFYEAVTFLSHILVTHEHTPAANSAGNGMLYLGIIGSFFLLLGIYQLYTGVGTLEIKPLFDQIAQSGLNSYWLLIYFTIGFGIKAGMTPTHIWLPKVDPVAPAPVSALLCALFIKTGVYGILRVVDMIFTPTEVLHNLTTLLPAMNFGYLLLWVGIVSMFFGAFMALLSNHAKKLLAYSSISQMGYIIMGIGAASYLGPAGALGFAGALYHVVNHAFFKACLFLVIGAIYMVTHELDITVVRGMAKKVPLITVIFLIAFAGIGGLPGFNGYVSKTLLHHALVEAAEHSQAWPLLVAEKIFVLTSAMTLCYFTKFFRGLFLGDVPEQYDQRQYRFTWPVYTALLILGVIIVAVGLFPHFLLHKLIIPALSGFTFDPHQVEHLYVVNVWNWHDIQGMLVIIALAAVLFWAMDRFNFFAVKFPRWLSIDYLFYQPLRAVLRRWIAPLREARNQGKARDFTSHSR
jgi:hydrogenase-4 component B